LDEEKADPYYIAAFLSSDLGIASLKSITVGATIPNIGVGQLEKLLIPLPPLERQQEISERYQKAKDELVLLKLRTTVPWPLFLHQVRNADMSPSSSMSFPNQAGSSEQS